MLASVSVSLSNFAFHVVLSRLLGPVSYGALGALVNVTAVAAVPLAAIQVTVAQSIATRPDPLDTPPLGRLLRIAAVVSLVGVAVWLAATPTLDRFFHLSSPRATIWLGVWLVPAVLGSTLEGVLLGQRRFGAVALGQFLGAGTARLAGGVLLVAMGFGITGGVVATVIGSTVLLVIYGWALRGALFAGGRFVPRVGDAVLSTVALGGAALLTSLDAWLGRHFLAARPAGLFVAAATAGNIALFLPSALTTMYFPRLAASRGRGPEGRQALSRATTLVSLVGLGTAGAIACFPGGVVSVLFGPAFAHARVALGTVALADAGIAIASCLVYFQVARRSRLALTPWLCCGLAVGLAAVFHGSIEVLAVDMVVACWALVFVLAAPTAMAALRTLAEDTSTIGRQAILLDEPVLDLSVVVPFYNVGAGRLAAHLAAICETLAASGVTFELVPVSDGSTDGSPDALATLVDRLPALPPDTVRPIVFTENRGKGEALRAGLAHGRGRYLGFIDGDGDIPAQGLAHFVGVARQHEPEIVVGSKRHREADVQYPPLRRLYSASYQALTAGLFGLRVRDTQTGIKLVRRDVLAEVLPRMVEKRFAFDLELLAVAHRIGYRQVAELPVTIGERFPSTISPRAVWRMLQDTLAVFWRLRPLRFYDPPLTEMGVDPAASGSELAHRLTTGAGLRILLCSRSDPRSPDVAVYFSRLARTWAANGHHVTCFTSAADDLPSLEFVDGLSIVRRGGRHSVNRQARLFWERLGRGRFDLVVDEVDSRPFEAGRWARGTPVVGLCHELAWARPPRAGSRMMAGISRFIVELSWLRRVRDTPIVTGSDATAAAIRASGIADVTVVPGGPGSVGTDQGGGSPLAAGTGGMLPEVVRWLQERQRAAAIGEDVAVAWRRAMAPIASLCDRRGWSLLGLAALVGVAPAVESGASGAGRVLSLVAVACFVVGAAGAGTEAMRNGPAPSAGSRGPSKSLPASPARWLRPLPVLVVAVICAAAAQTWFRGALERTVAVSPGWTHLLAIAWSGRGAGSETAYLTAMRLPLAILAVAVHAVGGSFVLAEQIGVTLLFACVGASTALLLLALGMGSTSAVLGAVAYAFSPYLAAMAGVDTAYLAAMALLPSILAWVVIASRPGRATWRLYAALFPIELLLGIAAQSPPLAMAGVVALAGGVVSAGWVNGSAAKRFALRRGIVGAVVLIIASAYWLVPLLISVTSNHLVAQEAHRHWEWVQNRSTIDNALWLNTSPSWFDPSHYPYASRFERFPLVLWRYAMPMCAFALMAVGTFKADDARSQRMLRLAVLAAAAALASVVLATANGTPGGPLFRLLSALPLGWMFADPGRFLFVAALGYAVLIAVLVDQSPTLSLVHASTDGRQRAPLALRQRILAPSLLCGVLIVPGFPLLTGAVVHATAHLSERRAVGVTIPRTTTVGAKENRWP